MHQIHDRHLVDSPRPVASGRVSEWVTATGAALSGIIGAWLYWAVGDAYAGWGLVLMMLATVLVTIYVALVTTRKTG